MFGESWRTIDRGASMDQIEREKQRQQKSMPDVKTACDVLCDAFYRLKSLGFNDARYCPKDESLFEVIEAGSTGIHKCKYVGRWPDGKYWIVKGDGDMYSSTPILYRLIDEGEVIGPSDRVPVENIEVFPADTPPIYKEGDVYHPPITDSSGAASGLFISRTSEQPGIFKSQDGTQIEYIQVTTTLKEPAHLTPYDEARDEARDILRNEAIPSEAILLIFNHPDSNCLDFRAMWNCDGSMVDRKQWIGLAGLESWRTIGTFVGIQLDGPGGGQVGIKLG